MARERLIPDLALISPARRARETWKLVRGALPNKIFEREADIYEVSGKRILDVIRAVEPGIRTLLIVGHNPGIENAASLIMANGDADAVRRMHEKFATAGLAVIDLDLDGWDDIAEGSGYLERFVTPRSLG